MIAFFEATKADEEFLVRHLKRPDVWLTPEPFDAARIPKPEACEILSDQGISANQLQIRWLVPLHGEAILDILKEIDQQLDKIRTEYVP